MSSPFVARCVLLLLSSPAIAGSQDSPTPSKVPGLDSRTRHFGAAVELVGESDGAMFVAVSDPEFSAKHDARGYRGIVHMVPVDKAQPTAALMGYREGDNLAWEISALGDLDGNARDWYAILARPRFDVGNGHHVQPCYSVVAAGSSMDVKFLVDGLTSNVRAFEDVNGDGRTDLVAGAWRPSELGKYSPVIGIYSGLTGELLRERSFQAKPSIEPYVRLGDLGDVNGDGHQDIVASYAVNEDPAEPASERVAWVVCGSTGETLHGMDFQAHTLHATAIGDVNGDAKADIGIVVGQGTHSERLRVLSGADGSLLYEVAVPDAELVRSAGDIDGDGTGDLAIGVPWRAFGGRVVLVSGRSGAEIRTYGEKHERENLGCSLARPVDLDGDGVPDVLAGEFAIYLGVPGSMHLFSGSSSELLRSWPAGEAK